MAVIDDDAHPFRSAAGTRGGSRPGIQAERVPSAGDADPWSLDDALFGMLSFSPVDEDGPRGEDALVGAAMRRGHGRHGAARQTADAVRDPWDRMLDWADRLPITPGHMYDHELLTLSQERLLAERIQAGLAAAASSGEGTATRAGHRTIREGRRAMDILIRANLRLARVMTFDARPGSSLPDEDRIAFGILGLFRAAAKFDPDRGRFSTYATWWIRQSAARGCDDTERLIRLPVHTVDDLRHCRREEREMRTRLHRTPTLAEVAAECDIEPSRLAWLRMVSQTPLSLDDVIDRSQDSGESAWREIVLDEDAPDPGEVAEHRIEQLDVLAALDRFEDDVARGVLPKRHGRSSWAGTIHRDMQMFRLRLGFVDGEVWMLDRIGHEFGVTRERVRQIVTRLCEDPDLRRRIALAAGREDLMGEKPVGRGHTGAMARTGAPPAEARAPRTAAHPATDEPEGRPLSFEKRLELGVETEERGVPDDVWMKALGLRHPSR
jgi:RNA polymerase sigma factor (sigma-70 family)